MKRYICLIISLCLILSSFSICFAAAADWSTTDQQNLSNAASRLYYNNYSAAYYLYQINSKLSTVNTYLSDIYSALFDSGDSVAEWLHNINSWLSPIYNSINAIPVDLFTIIGALGYTDSNSTYHPYLSEYKDYLRGVGNYGGITSSSFNKILDAHNGLPWSSGAWYSVSRFLSDGTSYNQSINWSQGSPIGNLAVLFNYTAQNITNIGTLLSVRLLSSYDSPQNVVNWGSLSTSTFTPTSSTDGIYKYLNSIQAPVARLSYVLASDERIAAQQAAALAEQEVVDDFIDPAGDSSATASDFGSISNLSSGYQHNFGSTASVTGIFDIFDSNNFGWFSSETFNQLDTTVATRGSSFETPLLDQQLEDISRALGVDYAN